MEDEAAARLDGPAVVDRAIGRFSGIDPKLFQKRAKAKAGPLVTDTDAHGAILVVDAHGDYRSLEARVGHSRHGQKQLAREERRTVHVVMMERQRRTGKAARRLEGATHRSYLAFSTRQAGD
jgi:hypothetical protein